MAERSMTGAQPGRVADSPLEILARAADCLLEGFAARQARRDGCGERAAGAVRMRRVDARTAHFEVPLRRAHDIDDLGAAVEVSALHHYDARPELADPPARLVHV